MSGPPIGATAGAVDYFAVDAWYARTPVTALATVAGKETAPAAEAPPTTATTATIGCGSPVGRRQYVQLTMALVDYRQPLVNDVGGSIAVVLKHAATCCPPPCRPISFTLDISQSRLLGRRAIYVAAGAMAMSRFAANRQFFQETAALGEGSWGGNAIIKRNRATGWMWAPIPERPDAVGAAGVEHVEPAAAYPLPALALSWHTVKLSSTHWEVIRCGRSAPWWRRRRRRGQPCPCLATEPPAGRKQLGCTSAVNTPVDGHAATKYPLVRGRHVHARQPSPLRL